MPSTPFTAVQDHSRVTLALIKTHLRVDTANEDDLITFYVGAACVKADNYLNNPFTDVLGNFLGIPSDVDVWVLQTASKFYYNRTIGVNREQIQDTGMVAYQHLADIDINYELLKPWRLEPGFGGIFL